MRPARAAKVRTVAGCVGHPVTGHAAECRESFRECRPVASRYRLRPKFTVDVRLRADQYLLAIHPWRTARVRNATVTASNVAVLVRLATLLVGLGSVGGLIWPAESRAQTSAAPVARAVSVQGAVEARRAGQTAWQPVTLNATFSPGDVIRVLDRGRADIAMLDQSMLRLNANTELTVEPVKEGRAGVVSLLRGATHFFSRGPRSLEVQTPFTVAGVRGTEFYIGLEPDRALLTVFEGTVLAQNPAGSLTLTSGQSAVAQTGKAPVTRVVARPRGPGAAFQRVVDSAARQAPLPEQTAAPALRVDQPSLADARKPPRHPRSLRTPGAVAAAAGGSGHRVTRDTKRLETARWALRTAGDSQTASEARSASGARGGPETSLAVVVVSDHVSVSSGLAIAPTAMASASPR